MKSFKSFIESSLNKETYTHHIHEFEHHSLIPHGGFNNPSINDDLMEAMDPHVKEAKVVEKLHPILKNLWNMHGPADSKPAPNKELKSRIEKRFDELSSMSPKERKLEFSIAKSNLQKLKIGHPVSSNEKTDTSADIPTHKGTKGQIPLGMSFAPDHAKHYTSQDGSKSVHRNVCAGSTESCRSACLAKHGNYEFIPNKVAIAARTQMLTHNENSTRHSATLIYHALHSSSNKANKSNKSVLFRGSITDDTGADLLHDAIAKHFPHVQQMGYTKKLSTQHNPEKNIHTIYSDSGPSFKTDKSGKPVGLNRENIQRAAIKRKATTERGMPSYVVFNKKRPKIGAPDKELHDAYNKVKTIRRYDLLPSSPASGEKHEYHHLGGYGRILHNKKSYKYQDHPVADPIKDVHGKMRYPAEHDSRNVDHSSRSFKTPEGKKVGHVVVALATRSTSNKDLHDSGFFHHWSRVDNQGVYHDSHPKDMEEAGFSGVKHEKLTKAPTGVKSGLDL